MREQIFVIRHADECHISHQWTSSLKIRSILIDLRHKHVQQMERTVGVLEIAEILLEIDQKLPVDDGSAIIECHMDYYIVGWLHQIASDAEQTFVSRDEFHIANAFIAVSLVGGALQVLDILFVRLQNNYRINIGRLGEIIFDLLPAICLCLRTLLLWMTLSNSKYCTQEIKI